MLPREYLSRCLLGLLLTAVLAAPAGSAVAGETLVDLRDAAERNDSDSDGDWDDEDQSGSFVGELLGEIFGPALGFAVASPWWGPHVALADDLAVRPDYPAAPYFDDIPGRLLITSPAVTPVRGWAGRAGWHYGTDFGDLQWSTARLQMDTAARFGFDAEWTRWVESTGRRNDSLSIGDANLLYRFAQSEQLEFHTGIGVNWLADGSDGEAGINFTYGISAFPARPWTLSAVLDAGTLGDAGYFHGRFGAGAVWRRLEVFTGYEVYRISDVTLDGPFAGVGLWF